MISRLRIPCFSLQHTLECGQFFRFTKVLDTYIIQTSNRIFSVRQVGEFLFYEGVEEAFVIQFFRLDEDLDSSIIRRSIGIQSFTKPSRNIEG